MSEYYIHLLVLIGIYLLLAQSFNLVFGVGRTFNLAHIASYAVGAYATALLATEAGYPFWRCVLISMLLSGLFSFLIGIIALRLAEDYFAIGTLAFSFLVTAILINWKSLTRGVLGIPGIPRPTISSHEFSSNADFLLLLFTFVAVTQIILYVFFHNSYARSLRAQSEFRHGAQALGKNPALLQNVSFLIASCIAGLAGSFFAYYIMYIDPSSFALHEMVFVLTIVVVGKPGSFWGTIAATAFLVLLPEPLRELDIPASILGHMRQMIYALILFAVVYVNRARLFPIERKI